MIGPHTNRRMVRSLAPARSSDDGITAIAARVAVGPVGGGIAPAVEDHDAVDGDFDAVGEARHEHRPGALRLLVLPGELAAIDRLIVGGGARPREVRQRDRMLVAAFAERELGHRVARGRFRQGALQGDGTEGDDQGLQQHILDQGISPQPAVGRDRFRRSVAHSRIKPCCTASNTASPPVWTSSLR